MRGLITGFVGAALLAGGQAQAAPGPGDSGEAAFRDTYRELIETNTTLSVGDCTLAAHRMAARLSAAGIPDAQIMPFAAPDHPKEGGLVAIYPGSDTKAKAILLLAHIDVVEAKRADWTRDPFMLVEEGDYFYARGAQDDKAQAAIWTDMLVRFARAHYRPRHTVKLALTCGEETSGAFNGAQWLSQNRRALIDAEFALNEGGGGRTDGKPLSHGGHLVEQTVMVGEKAYQDFTFTVTNPGGHSSQPVRSNAIYELGDALAKLRDYEFPLQFNDTTRAYFTKAGAARGGAMGAAMIALAANPADHAAEALVNTDKQLHSMLRTTCVPTLIEGGHALNALPQRATANVNCRMFPGRSSEETLAALKAAVGDPAVGIVQRETGKPIAQVPPLDPMVIVPMERLVARYFPGVPFMPTMSTGATDGLYMEAVGIPTYGTAGEWSDPDGNGIHGLNERMEVKSLRVGRAFLYDLVRAYADRP